MLCINLVKGNVNIENKKDSSYLVLWRPWWETFHHCSYPASYRGSIKGELKWVSNSVFSYYNFTTSIRITSYTSASKMPFFSLPELWFYSNINRKCWKHSKTHHLPTRHIIVLRPQHWFHHFFFRTGQFWLFNCNTSLVFFEGGGNVNYLSGYFQ